MEKILSICHKLNFTPNALDCYGIILFKNLKQRRNEKHYNVVATALI